MERSHLFAAISVLFMLINNNNNGYSAKPMFSSRLIHRFSGEKKSFGQMRMLLDSDLKRQRLKLGGSAHKNQLLLGTKTFNYGNELGWLHYTWVDIGTPKTSFLVALDTGSDTSWVPCDCIQCAPLSLSYYNVLDRELNEYKPSHSNSSRHISCSHELCKMANCKTPTAHCPYTVEYLSEDTSSSGYLFEDKLHLASVGGNKLQSTVQASIIIGCGSKQSGSYLDGIAPDGLMALGPGDISIPSLLAKSGLVSRSFSFCYDKSNSGTLFFGDQGPASQKSTSFLPSSGVPNAYIVKVESYCIGNSCLKDTGYKAQVDTGSSFTYLPSGIYDNVVSEFHRQINAPRIVTQGFEYCYKARSLKLSNIPNLKLVFSGNQSLTVDNPMFRVVDDQGDLYCLGVQAAIDRDFGIIGQNFLMGYRMVFDWENLKLGWSMSNCQDMGAGSDMHLTPPPGSAPPNPLPTNQQQQNPPGRAVAPAVAGRAPSHSSAASTHCYCIASLLLLLCTACITYLA